MARKATTIAPSLVLVNTGDGKGKSSAAFGVMLRALARGWRVAVIQFIKSDRWKVGEEKIAVQLGVDWLKGGDGFTWESPDLDQSRGRAVAAWELAAAAIAAAWLADRAFGDPARRHPVAGFGLVAVRLEARVWRASRAAGAAHVALLVGGAVAAVAAAERALAGRPWLRRAFGLLVLWASPGGRSLERAGLGLRGAVNTLDAMVGHRSARYARFGWAAARLDDAASWPAARLSALAAIAAAPLVGGAPREAWRAAWRDGPAHPSPNAGRVEGAFAGALGVRVGGVNRYAHGLETRPAPG